MEPQPQGEDSPETASTSTLQSRAEQLRVQHAPFIERAKRSIAAHEVEAAALYGLLRTANQAEKLLVDERDEARQEIEIERLETDLVRERLRAAEAQLAEVRDLSHVKETAHTEEVSILRKRCSAMKRKIEYLSTGQKRELENRIAQLEKLSNGFRKDLMEITSERDEWRETAISTEQELKEMKAKQSKVQSLSALLETERTLSVNLRKQLQDAQQATKSAERESAKLSAQNAETGNLKKALTAEKEKATELRQKLKDANTAMKQMKRDETKMRRKCDDLESRLREALERAAKSEERAVELENRPATRSRGLTSPGGSHLMSPAPLAFGKRPAADMASESKSRFTITLPQGIQDDRRLGEESIEHSQSHEEMVPTPRSKRKSTGPQKLAPTRKPLPEHAEPNQAKDSELLRGRDTKKRQRVANVKESNGPAIKVDSPGLSTTQVDTTPSRIATPQQNHGKPTRITRASSPATRLREHPQPKPQEKKHGKATRKTTASSPAKRLREHPQPKPREKKHGKAVRKTTASSPAKRLRELPAEEQQEELQEERGLEEAPRRTLRSRRPVSYNYDEEGRDLVDTEADYEVGRVALQPVRTTRSARSQRPGVVTRLEFSEPTSGTIDSPSRVKRRRMETVRKQVPITRDKVK